MPVDFLNELLENIRDSLGWVVLWSGLALVLLIFVWITVPVLTRRFFLFLDSILPSDYAALAHPAGRLSRNAFSLIILIFGLFLVGATAVGNLNVAQDTVTSAARGTVSWATNQGVKGVLVIIPALLLYRLASRSIPRIVNDHVRQASEGDSEGEIEKRVTTLTSALTATATVTIVITALFLVLSQIGVNLGPLLAAAGVVGIAVGFGAQSLIRDIFAGVFILMENQYRIGDVVNVAGIGGLVEDINLRRTVLRDLDYIQHYIPNGEIRTASNLTKVKSRVNINIPVAYKEDLETVIEVLNQVGQELAHDPDWESIILDAPQVLRVDSFADSGVEIKVLGEVEPIRQWDVMGQYRLRVKKRFDELGIEIPFPHTTLYWGTGQQTSIAVRNTSARADAPASTTQTPTAPPAAGQLLEPENESN